MPASAATIQNDRVALKSPPMLVPASLLALLFETIAANHPTFDCLKRRLDARRRQKTGKGGIRNGIVNRMFSAAVSAGSARVSSASSDEYRAKTPSAHCQRHPGPSAFPSPTNSTKNCDRTRDNRSWK